MGQEVNAKCLFLRDVPQRRFDIVTDVSLPIGCFETSVTNNMSELHNVSEELGSHFATEAFNHSKNRSFVYNESQVCDSKCQSIGG